jgi:hypothetical protein
VAEGFEDWSGRTFRQVNLNNTVWKEADLVGARFSGRIDGLIINDVEIAPLIAAEMDRRHPERLKLRPKDHAGAAEAWDVIESLWAASKARAASVDEAVLHTRPEDDEFSWSESFRHLVFVADAWISKNALGIEDWHPIGVPPSFWPAPEGIDVDAAPTWAEVVDAREGRMAFVRSHLGTVDLGCLRVVLDEEWAHNSFANRDLDQLLRSER